MEGPPVRQAQRRGSDRGYFHSVPGTGSRCCLAMGSPCCQRATQPLGSLLKGPIGDYSDRHGLEKTVRGARIYLGIHWDAGLAHAGNHGQVLLRENIALRNREERRWQALEVGAQWTGERILG